MKLTEHTDETVARFEREIELMDEVNVRDMQSSVLATVKPTTRILLGHLQM